MPQGITFEIENRATWGRCSRSTRSRIVLVSPVGDAAFYALCFIVHSLGHTQHTNTHTHINISTHAHFSLSFFLYLFLFVYSVVRAGRSQVLHETGYIVYTRFSLVSSWTTREPQPDREYLKHRGSLYILRFPVSFALTRFLSILSASFCFCSLRWRHVRVFEESSPFRKLERASDAQQPFPPFHLSPAYRLIHVVFVFTRR